jgi:hypothetical protein
MRRLTSVLAVAAILFVVCPAAPAAARDERDVVAPDGTGAVPAYRKDGPALLVCKTDRADLEQRTLKFPADLRAADVALWTQCQTSGYRTVQEAVNAATQPATTIKILPGVYLEEPSLAAPTAECAGLTVLSYEQQVTCPHNQNLVAILGKKDLQIEGVGATGDDVVIDAQYRKQNAVRADRSPGLYLRNISVQHTTVNAVYVVETDGFAIDGVIGRWTDGYGFHAFAADHGLFATCEAYGNGDAGIGAEASANLNGANRHAVDRYAIEIRGCASHNNLLGYSGTAGDSVWAHDNTFANNTVGVSTDSASTSDPGLPQNHALFEKNVIAANNQDYYRYVRDGTCAKPPAQRGYESGVVCPALGVPTGTGVVNPGGNYNIWRANWIYDNAYAGFATSWVPGFVRENNKFGAQFDTSHHNQYYDNAMGVTRKGEPSPNGRDFWWDGQGVGSCWQRPSSDGAEPRILPVCGAGEEPAGFGTARYLPEPGKALKLFVCSDYDLAAQRIPADCEWFGAHGWSRIEVKYALGEAVLLGLVLLILWWRLLGGSTLAFGGLALALGGLVTGVYGTLNETTPLSAIGLGLLGLGWLCVGVALRRRGRNGLGWLTLLLALFAVAGGVDQGLYILPWIPAPPSVFRIALEFLWVPAALVAAGRGRMLAVARPRREGRGRSGGRGRPSNADPLEHYAATLWQ